MVVTLLWGFQAAGHWSLLKQGTQGYIFDDNSMCYDNDQSAHFMYYEVYFYQNEFELSKYQFHKLLLPNCEY